MDEFIRYLLTLLCMFTVGYTLPMAVTRAILVYQASQWSTARLHAWMSGLYTVAAFSGVYALITLLA